MSVLDRTALDASPLADLHAIASELSIDGYRRLRRGDLIDAILHRQEDGADGPRPRSSAARSSAGPAARRGTGRRSAAGQAGGDAVAADEVTADAERADEERADEERADEERADEPVADAATRDGAVHDDTAADTAGADEPDPEARADDSAKAADEEGPASTRRRRGRRGGRVRAATRDDADPAPEADEDASPLAPTRESEDGLARGEEAAGGEEEVEGVVELLANGSGFVRVNAPDPSDDDVYISSAQVKRCELVSGDRVGGPKRAPRRSERFASLIRIETINGRPASELADSVRFDDLLAAFPSDRLKVGSDDPTLKAIEWLTPFGKGSRVTIVGGARAGKTEALRRLAIALAGSDDLTLSVVLAGVRPEEIPEWSSTAPDLAPVAAVGLGASEDARTAAIEPVIDQARRLAARGADAVVLIDTLDGASPGLARKALASARNIVDGGPLTVIATASAPLGGETTVVSLDVGLASIGRFPALDLTASGTIRPERLVGEAGAEAIARARAEAAADDDE